MKSDVITVLAKGLGEGNPPKLRSNGRAEDTRISLIQRVCHGVKGVVGREVVLVMTVEETMKLAIKLLRFLPVVAYEGNDTIDQLEKLTQVLRIGVPKK